jgi:hypothetical protein
MKPHLLFFMISVPSTIFADPVVLKTMMCGFLFLRAQTVAMIAASLGCFYAPHALCSEVKQKEPPCSLDSVARAASLYL